MRVRNEPWAPVRLQGSSEVRDTVLRTGMTDGMERSYQRLEADVLVGGSGVSELVVSS